MVIPCRSAGSPIHSTNGLSSPCPGIVYTFTSDCRTTVFSSPSRRKRLRLPRSRVLDLNASGASSRQPGRKLSTPFSLAVVAAPLPCASAPPDEATSPTSSVPKLSFT
eukprot:4876425-Prymnesium_polylepis.7